MMNRKPEEGAPLSPWVIAIAAGNIIFHLAFYNTLGFHRDELLYFSLGQHPAAGYASVPPFTGLVAWLMIRLSGYSLLAVRIVPMLLSGALVILAAAIARELRGKTYAQVITALAICVSSFNMRGFSLFMPVCFDIFFWTLVYWLILKWINTETVKYLLLLGLAAGTGMLNKYLLLLQVSGVMVALLFSPYRSIFVRKSFYLAAVIAFLVFLPNLVWQIRNHLPVLTHMQALRDSQLVHVSRTGFLMDQLFLGSLAGILMFPGMVYLLLGKNMKPWRFLAVAGFIVLFALMVLRGKSYYTFGLFPLWIAAGGVYWENTARRTFTRLLVPLLMVLLTLPVLPMGIPVFGADRMVHYFAWMKDKLGFDAPLRWETGRYHDLPQDYADMLGWDEIASNAAKAWELVPDKTSAMIYAQNYGQAGAVMVLGKKYGLPEPVCFAESFYYWFPRNPEHEITALVYINDEMGDDVKELFGDIRVIGRVSNPLAREFGTTVWLCSSPTRSFNEFWRERTPRVKSPFE